MDFWQDRLESTGEKLFNSVQRIHETSFTNPGKRTHTSLFPFQVSHKSCFHISKDLLLFANTTLLLFYCHEETTAQTKVS